MKKKQKQKRYHYNQNKDFYSMPIKQLSDFFSYVTENGIDQFFANSYPAYGIVIKPNLRGKTNLDLTVPYYSFSDDLSTVTFYNKYPFVYTNFRVTYKVSMPIYNLVRDLFYKWNRYVQIETRIRYIQKRKYNYQD